MATGYLQTLWKTGDLNKLLAQLQASGSIHFHKTLARKSQKRVFGQCEQLTLPFRFIEEHAVKLEQWIILRTFSSSKPWRVRASVDKAPSGSPKVKFVGGWREFVVDNRLWEGDSLVFVLNVDARSEFQVFIFRGSGASYSSSKSFRTPARKRSDHRAIFSEQTEKGRYNLRSAGEGNIRKTGALFSGESEKVEEMWQQNLGGDNSCDLLESDHGPAPSFGYDVEQKSGVASEVLTFSECKSLPRKHGANSVLPSFYRRLSAYNGKDPHGRMEVPASFVRAHGTQLHDDVELQGIHQESPVRMVTCHRSLQGRNATRLYFTAGWRAFLKENGLKLGQELQFTLTSESFFVVRVVI